MSEENVSCPVCGETFIDKRGLSSHARHKHNMNSDELAASLKEKPHRERGENNFLWKAIGGIALAALAIIAFKKMK